MKSDIFHYRMHSTYFIRSQKCEANIPILFIIGTSNRFGEIKCEFGHWWKTAWGKSLMATLSSVLHALEYSKSTKNPLACITIPCHRRVSVTRPRLFRSTMTWQSDCSWDVPSAFLWWDFPNSGIYDCSTPMGILTVVQPRGCVNWLPWGLKHYFEGRRN